MNEPLRCDRLLNSLRVMSFLFSYKRQVAPNVDNLPFYQTSTQTEAFRDQEKFTFRIQK